jgi:predicted ATPase
MRTCLGRRHRDGQRRRDFGHRQGLDVVQDDHGTVVIWQLLQRRSQHAGKLRLQGGIAELGRPVVDQIRMNPNPGFLAALAESLAGTGDDVIGGLAIVDATLAQSDKTEERWLFAELLRLKGELVLLHGPRDGTVAHEHFQQSLGVARQQGALAWELRAAMSLARLWQRQRRTSQARALLGSVYRRFSEGFDTTDLVAAKTLLASLRG